MKRKYIIKDVKSIETGTTDEGSVHRIGRLVEIEGIRVGERMIMGWNDESGTDMATITSPVVAVDNTTMFGAMYTNVITSSNKVYILKNFIDKSLIK